MVQAWILESAYNGLVNVEEEVLWFRGAITQIYDASIPWTRTQQGARLLVDRRDRAVTRGVRGGSTPVHAIAEATSSGP